MNKDVLLKEFEKLEELKMGDFIKIEQYGGGPDESCLKGTRNALNHFAWEILKVSLYGKDEYSMYTIVDENSVAGIDSIEVVELIDGKYIEYVPTIKDKIIKWAIMGILMLMIFSSIYGITMFLKRNFLFFV